MKTLKQYIIESSKKYKDIVDCAEKIDKWFKANFKDFYDEKHGEDENQLKKCDLLDNKKVKADCAGYLGAVLCLAGYCDDPLDLSVKYGSFNMDGHINNKKVDEEVPDYINIKYMKDLPGNWHAYKLKSITEWPECKPGDILYSGGHVAIYKDPNHLYQCTQFGSTEARTFKAYWRLEK